MKKLIQQRVSTENSDPAMANPLGNGDQAVNGESLPGGVVIKQEPGVKQFGRHGDIKRMMKILSKRRVEDHVDLELVCQDGKLAAHKFIVGAQSQFLKKLILQSSCCSDEPCSILFPDVKSSHMETVLKFLYTGKLAITIKEQFTIKDLLENVLHIDAKVTLPENIAPPSSKPPPAPTDDRGGGGSSSPPHTQGGSNKRPGPGPSGHSQNGASHSGEPSEKRSKPNENNSNAAEEGMGESKEALRRRLGLPANIALSRQTPHASHAEDHEHDDTDDIQVLPSPEKTAPELVSLEDEDRPAPPQPQPQQALPGASTLDQLEHLVFFQAPRVISKRTGGPAPTPPSPQPRSIAQAPRVVAKSTGYHPSPRQAVESRAPPRLSQDDPLATTPDPDDDGDKVISDVSGVFESVTAGSNSGSSGPLIKPPAPGEKLIVKKRHDVGQSEPSAPSTSAAPSSLPPALANLPASVSVHSDNSRRSTRTSTGSIQRTNLNEQVLETEAGLSQADAEEVLPVAQMEAVDVNRADADDDDYHPGQEHQPFKFPLPLPPGLPGPHNPEGYVIHRGKWVAESSIPKRKEYPGQGGSSVKKYNYRGKNACTITGKMLDRTVATLAEPDGRWPCDQCPNVYSKQASLQAHYRRNHNPRLKVKCPECPKMLSHKSALAKHLLSHRPEEQWPFQCQFCGKYFQAKGDIPKHWQTSRHINDPRIPKPGTPEWSEALNATKKFDLQDFYARNGGTIPMSPAPSHMDDDASSSSGGQTPRYQFEYGDEDYDEDQDLILEASANLGHPEEDADKVQSLKPPSEYDEESTSPRPTSTDNDGAPHPKDTDGASMPSTSYLSSPGELTPVDAAAATVHRTDSTNSDGGIPIVTNVERPVRDTPTPFNISDILEENG